MVVGICLKLYMVDALKSGARGVVLLRPDQLAPFVEDHKSISTDALLALLIGRVDLKSVTSLPTLQLEVPASHAITKDSILLKCAAVQLGDGIVEADEAAVRPETSAIPTGCCSHPLLSR